MIDRGFDVDFLFSGTNGFFRDSEATNDYSDGSMKGGNLVMELLIFITLKLKIIEVEKFEADGIVRSVFRGGNRFFLGISFLKFCLLQLPVSPWAEIFSDLVIAVLKVGVFELMYKGCSRYE